MQISGGVIRRDHYSPPYPIIANYFTLDFNYTIILKRFTINTNGIIISIDPPSLNFSYPRSHTVVEGSNLHLHCVVTAGKPRPNITWYNARANNSELSNNTSLSLFNISRDQAGEYYCAGTNGIGPAAISRMGVVDVQCK